MISGTFSTASICRKNNPQVLQKRQQHVEELNRQVQQMLQRNPGRVPCWEQQRLMHLDALALRQGKRCIMWDDEGSGFYLVSEAPCTSTLGWREALHDCILRVKATAVDDHSHHACMGCALQMLKWDWINNRPAHPPSPEAAVELGW
jgi:hypothetical protein